MPFEVSQLQAAQHRDTISRISAKGRAWNASAITVSDILMHQLANGVDVKTIRICLGHSTPTTPLSIYAHTLQAEQIRAIDAVANMNDVKKNTENGNN